jgi:DNA invertase Pin-like site-specific DNA recombinase
MKIQVYGYLRVSGNGQIGGDGFKRQKEAISRFCEASNLKLVQTFTDAAVSGTRDGFDRDGLTDLMVSMKSNGVKTFVVESASRLARDLMVQEVILNDCRKHRITVYDSSGIDLTVNDDDPTRKMVRQILGAVAEFEKSSTNQKLAAARRRIRNSGKKCEGAPGYVDNHHPAVEIIKRMRRERISFKKIADYLVEQGIATLKGGKWTKQQVHLIWQKC